MRHQKVTSEFITLHDDIFVFNDPGTGKTRSVIWAIDYLQKFCNVKKVLVACPISVQPEWMREFFEAAPHIRVANLFGDKKNKLKALELNADVDIINHHGLAVLKDKLIAKRYDMLVIDEATRNFKSTRTNVYKAAVAIRKSKPMRTVIMTGTPMANSLMDAYPLLHMLYPTLSVARNKDAFQNTFMYKQGPFKWVPKQGALERVKEFLRPVVRFAAEDCIDLPELVYVNRHAELTKEQRVYFNEMKDSFEMHHPDGQVRAITSATKATKLLQILAGAVKKSDQSGEAITILPEPRLNVVLDILEGTQGQVLIFSPFLATIPLLLQALHGAGYEAKAVYGATSAGERATTFQEFRQGRYKALVCHPDVASHGLTLVNAKATVWYSPVYNQETYAQANKRMHRKGQVDRTVVYNIGAHPLEWKVYDLLKKKEAVQQELFNLFQNHIED
jgi:SNF2 family DNA or RNA helicase